MHSHHATPSPNSERARILIDDRRNERPYKKGIATAIPFSFSHDNMPYEGIDK